MGFRAALLLSLALFAVTIIGSMGENAFEEYEGFKITDDNSIIENYQVGPEDCEKLCNLQALCKGYQVDTITGDHCDLLADTEYPEVDPDFNLYQSQ